MLFDIDTGKLITHMPHSHEFFLWRGRLTVTEFDAIVDHLNSLINTDEIHTSSWIPGNNWAGTVYDPIYFKACNEDESLSGLCFGLFLWYVFQNRTDEWYCGKFEKDGVPIQGTTYFRKRF